MTDRDAWLNIAQAAQWLAEGRQVERMARKAFGDWSRQTNEPLHTDCEYRLKPEPPKPREWILERVPDGGRLVNVWSGPWLEAGETIRVREVLE
jgi:hypothetical protein